jgi:hypothetical protein
MDEIPDRTDVIVQFLAESQCSANQSPNTLTKRVVEPLYVGCLPTAR